MSYEDQGKLETCQDVEIQKYDTLTAQQTVNIPTYSIQKRIASLRTISQYLPLSLCSCMNVKLGSAFLLKHHIIQDDQS